MTSPAQMIHVKPWGPGRMSGASTNASPRRSRARRSRFLAEELALPLRRDARPSRSPSFLVHELDSRQTTPQNPEEPRLQQLVVHDDQLTKEIP